MGLGARLRLRTVPSCSRSSWRAVDASSFAIGARVFNVFNVLSWRAGAVSWQAANRRGDAVQHAGLQGLGGDDLRVGA